MIASNRFEEFVFGFVDRYNKDQQEKNIWEFFLHKVFDQSYEDFRNSVSSDSAPKKVEKEELTETVKQSFDMLKTFNPKG